MVNLLYCGNDNIFDGMLISLLSITKHTKSPLHVYALTMDLTDMNGAYRPLSAAQIAYLEDMIKTVHSESFIKLIDVTAAFKAEMTDSPNMSTDYTPYTLTRLFADTLTDLPPRLLYLDTDTVANADIEPIFETDIDDYEFAAVRDYLGKVFIRYDYQNAGVLYLNMDKIRETGLFAKARERCRMHKMWFPDQSALNLLVCKKKFLPRKYNEQRKLKKDTVIQHFSKSIRWFPFYHTVNIKPWEVEKVRTVYKLHAYDDVLDEYLTRVRMYKQSSAGCTQKQE
ncbi:glycosyltransferase family 8 protein [Treponema brennaborense]|uniref:Glycosyl transferase family 8 n=1 Tax=Treponema brennaborense (strain DSM 12168 / CIP 105900 / DD5/3) TaxID=906968 RepID=F4LP49_TREBD|nr:glycosyltransferase [Treponema brennaborense]AEE15925.1 glycosyl transferase family 8 [Treponema brennaborense DSM 12168]